MKGRKVLWIVLVLASIALLGLAGCQGQQAAAPKTSEQAVSGQSVSFGNVRLFSDPQKSNLVYEIDGNRVYQGTVQQGKTILFSDGKRVYRGANTTGEILFTIDGGRIFAGANTSAPLVYTVKNNRVYKGNEKGPILYSFDNDRMFKGPNTTGDIVFQANQGLTGNAELQALLTVLAEQAFQP